MNDNRRLPPTDCDECKRRFHPLLIYRTKEGKNICKKCIMELSLMWLSEELKKRKLDEINNDEYLKTTLEEKEYDRYLNCVNHDLS